LSNLYPVNKITVQVKVIFDSDDHAASPKQTNYSVLLFTTLYYASVVYVVITKKTYMIDVQFLLQLNGSYMYSIEWFVTDDLG